MTTDGIKKEIVCKRLDLTELFPHKPDAFAVVLDNVYTKEECDKLVRLTEEQGYTEALVGAAQIRRPENRNNYRCMLDSLEYSADLFERVKGYLPKRWLGNQLDSLNFRLRFLRYHPGEYFRPHNDGIFIKDESTYSFVTVHLYLNDVADDAGGETTFTTQTPSYRKKYIKTSSEPIKKLSVQPKVGRVLIFEHHLLHEGSELKSGVKYTARTDVFYKKVDDSGILTTHSRWGVKSRQPQYSF